MMYVYRAAYKNCCSACQVSGMITVRCCWDGEWVLFGWKQFCSRKSPEKKHIIFFNVIYCLLFLIDSNDYKLDYHPNPIWMTFLSWFYGIYTFRLLNDFLAAQNENADHDPKLQFTIQPQPLTANMDRYECWMCVLCVSWDASHIEWTKLILHILCVYCDWLRSDRSLATDRWSYTIHLMTSISHFEWPNVMYGYALGLFCVNGGGFQSCQP